MINYELNFISNSELDTISIGQKISKISQQGDVFALSGTLGMGKSVFARSFVQELCGQIDVPSPTFTLVQLYDAPDFIIYHFDLYRLKSPEEIFELGIEEAMYEGVCLIEWPEKMGAYLPNKAIKIEISPIEQGRNIKLIFNNEQDYQRFLTIKD